MDAPLPLNVEEVMVTWLHVYVRRSYNSVWNSLDFKMRTMVLDNSRFPSSSTHRSSLSIEWSRVDFVLCIIHYIKNPSMESLKCVCPFSYFSFFLCVSQPVGSPLAFLNHRLAVPAMSSLLRLRSSLCFCRHFIYFFLFAFYFR